MKTRLLIGSALAIAVALLLYRGSCSGEGPSIGAGSPVGDAAERLLPRSRAFTDAARRSLRAHNPPEVIPELGGTITVTWPDDPATLNNILRTDGYGHRICRLWVFPPLLDLDAESLELVPELAAARPELSADRRTYRWTLRQNVHWHRGAADGSRVPVTTRDVKFSYDLVRALWQRGKAKHLRPSLEPFTALEVIDDYTFEVSLDQPLPRAEFDFGWDFRLMPAHLVSTTADDFEEDPLGRAPVGYGPYRFETWEPDQQITLLRDESYPVTDRRPFYAERLRMLMVPELDQNLPLFRKGEIDICVINDPQRFEEATQDPELREKATFHEYYLDRWLYLGWDNSHWAFGDRRVRRAMTHLFPREILVERFYAGHASVVSGPYSIISREYNHEVEPLPYDKERARQLLQEAGFADSDGDGVLDRDGRKFEFTLLVPKLHPRPLVNGQEMFRDNLRDVGVLMQIDSQEFSEVARRARANELESFFLGWRPDPREEDLYGVFHSSMTDGGYNFVRYSSPECDRLLESFRTEPSEEGRLALSRQIHARIHEDHPLTFLVTPQSLVLISSRLRNVSVRRLGARYYDWWVPQGP